MHGSEPRAGLTAFRGRLFGTTIDGGSANNGTVFSVDPETGKENIIYLFQGGTDGVAPIGNLTVVGNLLYGTTEGGGSSSSPGFGTVLSIDPRTHIEKIVSTLDNVPNPGLLSFGGKLYGTIPGGGRKRSGEVFSVDPATGATTIVYEFDRKDRNLYGAIPYSGLT